MANKDTAEYSSSKSPDTRKHAEERETTPDARLIPGGAHGTAAPQGMAALDRDDVPSQAGESSQTRERGTGRPDATEG
jgi:hypothetical protein